MNSKCGLGIGPSSESDCALLRTVVPSARMPAPKFVERGKTVRCVRASVLLHPALHRAAKLAAVKQGITLSDMIAELVAKRMKWQKEGA